MVDIWKEHQILLFLIRFFRLFFIFKGIFLIKLYLFNFINY